MHLGYFRIKTRLLQASFTKNKGDMSYSIGYNITFTSLKNNKNIFNKLILIIVL